MSCDLLVLLFLVLTVRHKLVQPILSGIAAAILSEKGFYQRLYPSGLRDRSNRVSKSFVLVHVTKLM